MVFASPLFVSTHPHCDVLVLLSLTGADAYGTASLFRHRCQCQPHAWISHRRQCKTLSRLLWQFIFTVVVSELCSISVQAWGTDALWYNGRILFVVQRHTGARWQAGLWLCQGRNLHGCCRLLSWYIPIHSYHVHPEHILSPFFPVISIFVYSRSLKEIQETSRGYSFVSTCPIHVVLKSTYAGFWAGTSLRYQER